MTGHITTGLHLLTAVMGMYWGAYLTMTGLYGVPFSPWFAVVFAGGVILGSGAILQRSLRQRWTLWLPIFGSVMLATYFIPALVLNLPDFIAFINTPTSERVLAVVAVILTIASLLVAIWSLRSSASASTRQRN